MASLADEMVRCAQSDGPVFCGSRPVVSPSSSKGPTHPAETLKEGRGSCRDVALIFTEACRSVGIAARFVSGYQEAEPDGERSLHAWAEVYLSGVGRRGYDPSSGLAVADGHFALAAGPDPESAAPTGTLSGTALTTMTAKIDLVVS